MFSALHLLDSIGEIASHCLYELIKTAVALYVLVEQNLHFKVER